MNFIPFRSAGDASLAIATLVTACGGNDNPTAISSGTVLSNVTVVDTCRGALCAPMSVIVDGRKITQITARAINVPGAAHAVVGIFLNGRYFAKPALDEMRSDVAAAPGQ